MGRISLEQAERLREQERIQWHKRYFKQHGIEKTTNLIVKELRDGKLIPKNMKLKEYVDFLVAEVEQENVQ